MKKLTKLLSVLLAFVMALSCMTMMASAAKAKYQTVADLEALDAYSPYFTVTRLTTEERVSILFDFLDQTLAPMQNLNMGEVVNVLSLKLSINLTSVDAIFDTIDQVCELKAGTMYAIAATFVNLGIVEDLNVKSGTNWTKSMRRASSSQVAMVNNLLKLLSTNSSVIGGVFDNGIQLGIIATFINGLDLVPINNLVTNLPGAIKGIVLPLMGRQDDTATERNKYNSKSTDLITAANDFVKGLFTKPMNWTSYRTDASGVSTGITTALPTEADGTSRYFRFNDNGTITQFDYLYAGLLGDPVAGYVESVTYTMEKEFDTPDCTTYIYKAPANYEGDSTLKWYKAEGVADANGNVQSGYWLPTLRDAFNNGTVSIDINGADSVLGLLYEFAPYIFAEMAPTVLNGSAKKLMAEAFDVEFTKIGNKGDANLPAGEFFTKDQEYYTWEYSDYTVIDGVPYYRFQDEFFKGEIPTNISVFYSMINWNYEITPDFMNEFIPTAVGAQSAKGYNWALEGFNDLIKKAIDTMIADSWTVKGQTFTRANIFPWEAGSNAKLLTNLMTCARNFFNIAPEEIVDEYVEEAQFYDAMMNGTLKQAVNGLTCELVKLIMPQIVFADNIIDQPITAVAAIVVRELCTQLMPSYNFDAMIYTDYNNRTLVNGSADYWLDTTLYMGVNLGMFYLRNLADIGEDSATGYYQAMNALGALPGTNGDAMTFTATSQYVGGTVNSKNASWLYLVDWIVDWALEADVEWCWHFERLIDCGQTVDLATYQNPLKKLNKILLDLLPFDQLLNVSYVASEATVYDSDTFLERVLKNGIINCIVDLDVDKLQGGVEIPTGYFTQGNIADSLVKIVVNLLDQIFYKVAGNTDLINKSTINSVNTLLNQANIKSVVVNLISKLQKASETYNVLDPILPIVGMFVGWVTDPQKYAEPSIYFTNSWGSSYLYKDNSPEIKITNTAAGMLLKHRNSDVEDTAYSIEITNITLDGGVTTSQSFPITVNPGDTASVALTVPTTAGTTKATITYKFTGKDGQALGGTQVKTAYAYISNETDDLNETVAGTDKNYTINNDYKKYEFTKDIYSAVTDYTVTISYKGAAVAIGAPSSCKFNSVGTNGTNVQGTAANYFAHITSQSEAGFANAVYKTATSSNPGSTTGHIYKAKAGVTSETDFPYGIYDMGKTTVKYNNSGKDIEVDFIYYNDYDISVVKDKYIGYNLREEMFDDTAAWNAYETALRNVVALSDVAMKTTYVSVVQDQIEPAIEALETAYEALNSSSSSSYGIGDVTLVENALNAVETNPDKELNFQDHQLFEYFQYEKQRNAARDMINSVKGPEAPTKYIENEDASAALIDAIVAAQTKAKIKTGINATVTEPTADDMLNYETALANFEPATYSDLNVRDLAAKVTYYADFMLANKKAADKTFLNKEIAYATAQNYVESKYSADSWARYTAALAAAQAVSANADALESETFDAKYELMVAQNKLQLKERSMKEVGYMNEELIPLIEHANAIIDNYGSVYTTVAGVTEADAFAQLVKALGIRYDVTVDGVEREGILYSRSAVTFEDYDRTSTAKNKRAVDAAADKLRAAIENFTATAKLEAKDDTTTVDQTIRFIQGIVPGSIANATELLARVTVTGGDAITTASKAGNYGTGAKVEIKKNNILLATYFVVIYGDVNGDGAVDGFDAVEVDIANCTAHYMGDVYDDAADLDSNGKVDAADYAALVAGVKCDAAINQNPTNA